MNSPGEDLGLDYTLGTSDYEDEDWEFDDKGLNRAAQDYSAVLRVLLDTEKYADDNPYV